jgi:hypothetical protein
MMEDNDMIRVELICSSYNIEPSFIDSLLDYGLIEITELERERFIPMQRLVDLEKMIRLHYDLNINLEGIDTIFHLLNRISELQQELNLMKNKMIFYNIE